MLRRRSHTAIYTHTQIIYETYASYIIYIYITYIYIMLLGLRRDASPTLKAAYTSSLRPHTSTLRLHTEREYLSIYFADAPDTKLKKI